MHEQKIAENMVNQQKLLDRWKQLRRNNWWTFFSGNGTFHIVLIKKKQGAKILNLTLDKSSSREFHFIDKEKK